MRRALCVAALVLLGPASTGAGQARGPGDDPVVADPPPAWFKGNLHTHSLWSDGNDYPEMIGDWYRRQGYHFLALSDHNILSQGEKWIGVAEANARAEHD